MLISALGVSLTTVHAQEFDRGIVLNTFIPKGQWVVGNSISYSEYSNDNYQSSSSKTWTV